MNLYPYQDQAKKILEKEEKNLLVIAPTGAGKTWVGFEALRLAGAGSYIAPTRALCYEKFKELQSLFPEKVVVLGNKDYGLGDRLFRESDFRIITPWKLNQFITNCKNLVQFSPTIVVDEIHNLDPDVEIILTKLMVLHQRVKIVGLSATIHEDDEPKFSQWLKSILVKGEERPVPLVERVVHFEPDINEAGEEITSVSITENGSGKISQRVVNYSLDGYKHLCEIFHEIRESGDNSPVLIWTPYRKRAEKIANLFSGWFQSAGKEIDPALASVAHSLSNEASDHTSSLKNSLPYGVGMHHGGMSQREREIVYELASAGELEVIVTCLTLSQGVNLPCRHIIFESVYDFDSEEKRRLIDCSTFRQIEGRAGRPQFDTIGYAWIPVFSEVEKVEVEEVLLKYKASKIESRLYNEFFLTSQVPGLILLGFDDPEKLANFMKATFWGQALQDLGPLIEQFEKIISYLFARRVSETWQSKIILTDKGQKVARLGIHPEEYETIERLTLEKSLDYRSWVSELSRVMIGYNSDELYERALEMVVDYGLTAYTTSQATFRARDLADYVQRLLDISESFFALNQIDYSYRKEWREKVSHKFLYGNLVLVEKLAPALTRDQIKRLIRNLGEVLKKEPENLLDEDKLALARLLYGHYREFFPGKQSEVVASCLNLPHKDWIQIIREARETPEKGEKDES